MRSIVLAAKDVTVTFGRGQVVKGVDLEQRQGQITVLLGESGSGKTVFSRSIAGLAPAGARFTGSSTFDGQNLLDLGKHRMRGILGKRIAFVPQDPTSALDPMRRIGGQVVETLVEHGITKRGAAAKKRMIELLELVHISEPERVARCYPHEVSGGMRQRISIAIAISCDPELIIADEPSSALDASVGARVIDLLADLRDRLGTSIIFITHDIGVAARITRAPEDRVAVMLSGRLVEMGFASTVLSDARHPYTRALLAAEPSREVERGQLAVVPDGVRTAPWGDLEEVAPDHWVAPLVAEGVN